MKMDLSIVVPSFNTKKLTVACVKSILEKTKGVEYEVIVIDNGSTDGSLVALKKIESKRLVLVENKENLGFSGANNQGIEKSGGRFVLFLNSDTVIHDNVLKEMVGWMEKHPKVGIATCGLKNKDGSVQETGGYFPTLLRAAKWMLNIGVGAQFHPKRGFYRKEQELDWVTGAFMLVRREVVEKVSWDEDYFMYTEDVDYCFLAKKHGWKVVYLPQWQITHFGGASGTREKTVLREYEGVKIFYGKHYSKWQYLVLRILLKIGALGRMLVLGILKGRTEFEIYAKAFWRA